MAFPEVAPGVVDWIEQVIREDEQFDADISLHNTGDRIEEEVAERMDRLAQGIERVTYTVWHETDGGIRVGGSFPCVGRLRRSFRQHRSLQELRV